MDVMPGRGCRDFDLPRLLGYVLAFGKDGSFIALDVGQGQPGELGNLCSCRATADP